MKMFNIAIVALIALGSASLMDAKLEKNTTKMNTKNSKGTYQELVDQYEALVTKFEKLEAQREEFKQKNPSRDEMAKIDAQIAQIRENANTIYSQLQEFPQFSTFNEKTIPASPRYQEKYDEKGKECLINLKKAHKEADDLKKELTKKTNKK